MNAASIPEMVALPAGRIELGIPACPPRAGMPWIWHTGKTVEVPAFSVSRHPVTNAQYRGGSYMTCNYLHLWIAYRHEDPPDLRHESIGFRVAL